MMTIMNKENVRVTTRPDEIIAHMSRWRADEGTHVCELL